MQTQPLRPLTCCSPHAELFTSSQLLNAGKLFLLGATVSWLRTLGNMALQAVRRVFFSHALIRGGDEAHRWVMDYLMRHTDMRTHPRNVQVSAVAVLPLRGRVVLRPPSAELEKDEFEGIFFFPAENGTLHFRFKCVLCAALSPTWLTQLAPLSFCSASGYRELSVRRARSSAGMLTRLAHRCLGIARRTLHGRGGVERGVSSHGWPGLDVRSDSNTLSPQDLSLAFLTLSSRTLKEFSEARCIPGKDGTHVASHLAVAACKKGYNEHERGKCEAASACPTHSALLTRAPSSAIPVHRQDLHAQHARRALARRSHDRAAAPCRLGAAACAHQTAHARRCAPLPPRRDGALVR